MGSVHDRGFLVPLIGWRFPAEVPLRFSGQNFGLFVNFAEVLPVFDFQLFGHFFVFVQVFHGLGQSPFQDPIRSQNSSMAQLYMPKSPSRLNRLVSGLVVQKFHLLGEFRTVPRFDIFGHDLVQIFFEFFESFGKIFVEIQRTHKRLGLPRDGILVADRLAEREVKVGLDCRETLVDQFIVFFKFCD